MWHNNHLLYQANCFLLYKPEKENSDWLQNGKNHSLSNPLLISKQLSRWLEDLRFKDIQQNMPGPGLKRYLNG